MRGVFHLCGVLRVVVCKTCLCDWYSPMAPRNTSPSARARGKKGCPLDSKPKNWVKTRKRVSHMKPGCFQRPASGLGPGAREATHKPFEIHSLVCHPPSVSWPWALKPGILGLLFQVPVCKVREPYVGYELFAPQGEAALGFALPPDCGSLCCIVGFMVRLCLSLSYLLWSGFSLGLPLLWRACSASF